MVSVKSNNQYKFLIYSGIAISLVLTPFWNKDSLIIPKVIILFCTALYFIPRITSKIKNEFQHKLIKILLVLCISIIIQMLISTIVSTAPIEQQIFGRSGRGLGLITFYSLIILVLSAAVLVKKEYVKTLVFGLFIAGFTSSIYALLQKFGIDFLSWDSKTNGVIGTLGNPNFQSSFAAMTLVPGLIYFWDKKYNYMYTFLVGALFISTIVATQSTQGYINTIAALLIFLLIRLFYKKIIYFYALVVISTISIIVAICGMLNYGPLSSYLYKISVQSRGDFWRAAFNTANANPFFGVGIDSFGDSFLKYRDSIAANHSFAEFTDNSHNIFLEFSATGGYLLMILNLILIVLTILSFVKIQKNIGEFNRYLASIFAAWTVYQLQSIISPANIGMLVWNYIISGTFIGLAAKVPTNLETQNKIQDKVSTNSPFISIFLLIFGLIVVYPYFNVDRMQLQAMQTGNGDLAIKSTISYPESVLRYSVMGRALLDSKLPDQALYLAHSAVKFNPNAVSAWVLILMNPSASVNERENARNEILRLDPLNKDVMDYKL